MFREAGIECRASHSGGGSSSSSTGRGSRGGTFTGPTAAASAATTAVAAALSLSLARSLSSASPRNSLFSRTRDRVGMYIKIFRVFVGGKAAVAVGLLLLVASIFLSYSLPAPRRLFTSYLVDPASSICLSQRLSHACLSTSR